MKKTKRRPAAVIAAEKPRISVGGPRLIDRNELLAKTALSYPKIWMLMREGKFPRAKAAGGRTVWLESEVDEWIASLPEREFKDLTAKERARLEAEQNATA
jgi:predicted DNA-binding transcriptional regulator AlpA